MSEHGPGKLCEGCGCCCKSLPGAYHPDDFGLNMPEALHELFATGQACLDWRGYSGDRVYYPRPQTIVARGELLDPSYGGQCVHLSSTGCQLAREKMPAECRWLEPRKTLDADCLSTNGTSKRELADAWIPYQSLLILVVNAAGADLIQRGASIKNADPSRLSQDADTHGRGEDLSSIPVSPATPLANLLLLALLSAMMPRGKRK